MLIVVRMAGYGHEFLVEVRGLAGRLGVVSLGPGDHAWGLVSQVHSKFPLPCGIFWKLAVENEPITDKNIVMTGISAVTCVKYLPKKKT